MVRLLCHFLFIYTSKAEDPKILERKFIVIITFNLQGCSVMKDLHANPEVPEPGA